MSSVDSSESGDERQADARVGTVLAERYRIDALLGEGGMGRVYAAEHVLMRKRLAVKVLHRELTTVPEVVTRFEREAMAAANIEHSNVAAATDFGKLPDGAVFLVLEFVQGKNLRDEIAAGPFAIERALHIARQIASALGSAHALDIVHRDLKPENVMLVEKGSDPDFVKVLDFGIAKVPIGDVAGRPDSSQPITKAGMVFGTPEYMAPEQALGQIVDGRADLYALGIILFEMLAGVRPFSSKSQVGILGQQLSKPTPRFAERAPGIVVPPSVEQLVHKLLEKEASERFQRAEAVVEAIDQLLGAPPGRGAYRFTLASGSPMSARGSRPSFESRPGVPRSGSRPEIAAPPPNVIGEAHAPYAADPTSAPWRLGEPTPPPFSPLEPAAFAHNELSSATAHEASEAQPELGQDIALPPPGAKPPPRDRWSRAKQRSHSALRRGRDVALYGIDETRRVFKRLRVRQAYDWLDARRSVLPPVLRAKLAPIPAPVMLITAATLVVGLFVVVFIAVGSIGSDDETNVGTAPGRTDSETAREAASKRSPADPARNKIAGVAALQERAAERPTDAEVLVELAAALAAEKRFVEATDAVGKALAADPKRNADERVASVLFDAAKDSKASDRTLILLAGAMGARGADIIYDLAMTRGVAKDVQQHAEKWLLTSEFDRASSPALNVAAALHNAQTCPQRYALLLRAKNVGDARSLTYLKRWKARNGCGRRGRDDCFPCLRKDDRLDQSIAAIEQRVAR